MGDGSPDFSFSGLKTAVTKHVRETGMQAGDKRRGAVAGYQGSGG